MDRANKNICMSKYIKSVEASLHDTHLLETVMKNTVPAIIERNSEDYLRELLSMHDKLSSIY